MQGYKDQKFLETATAAAPIIDAKDQKTIAINVVPPQAMRSKRDLYIKIYKQEFIRELQFAWDVANDRATARTTFTEKLVESLKALPQEIPMIGKAVEALGPVLTFAANEIRDKEMGCLANLTDDLDLHRLEILLDVVAREAYRRYEYFIEYRLGDDPVKSIIPFAKAGVARSLEYLARKKSGASVSDVVRSRMGFLGVDQKSNDSKTAGIEFSESFLLAGLIEGRSGAFVQGWSNNKVLLNSNHKNKEVDAEEAYARSAMMHFAILNNQLHREYYVRKSPRHKEISSGQKLKDILAGDMESFYDFGYTIYRGNKNFSKDPRCGFTIMPLKVIKERYVFDEQKHTVFSGDLNSELKRENLSVVEIDKATLKKYIDWYRKQPPSSKNTIAHYLSLSKDRVWRGARFVSCHADLSDVSLPGINLSQMDLSGATLSGDLTGTQFNDSYLIGTRFIGVTSVKNASFQRAQCAFMQAISVDFSYSDFTQADFSFAKLNKSNLSGCTTLGTCWHQTDLKDIKTVAGEKDLTRQQSADFKEWQEKETKVRQALRDELNEQAKQFKQLDVVQQQISKRLQLAESVEFEKVFAQELKNLDAAHRQEFERVYNQIKTVYTDTNKRMDALATALPIKCKEQIDKVSGHVDQRLQEFESQLKNVLAEREQLRKMQEQIKSLVADQEARQSFEQYCREHLKQLEKSVLQAADKETVVDLKKQLTETQADIKALQKKNKEAPGQFQENYTKQINELTGQYTTLKADLISLQAQVQKELKTLTEQQDKRLQVLETELQKTTQKLTERMEKLEQRVDVLENWAKTVSAKLDESKVEDKATQEKVQTLQVELHKLVEKQQKSFVEQEHCRHEIATMQSKLATMTDAKEVTALKNTVKILQEDLRIINKKQENHEAVVKSQLEALQKEFIAQKQLLQESKTSNEAEQAKVQVLTKQLEEQQKNIASWQKEFSQCLAEQEGVNKKAVENLQKQQTELEVQIDKHLYAINKRVTVLEDWAKTVDTKLDASKITDKATQEKVQILKTELNKLVENQQKSFVEQERCRREIVAIQKKLETTSEAEAKPQEVIELKNTMKSLQDGLKTITEKQAKQKAVVKEKLETLQKEFAAQKQLLQESKATTEAEQEKLKALTQQVEKQREYFAGWQTDFTRCLTEQETANKKVADDLQSQYTQLESRIDKRLQEIERRLAVLQSAAMDNKRDISEVRQDFRDLVQANKIQDEKIQQTQLTQSEQLAILMKQFASFKKDISNAQDKKVIKPLIDPKLVINYYDLIFDKKITQGGFGKIYLGRWRDRVVVIKALEGKEFEANKSQNIEELIREIEIMNRLRDRNVVQIYGASVEKERPCLVMEYMEQGALSSVLANKTNITPEQQVDIALDIAFGLRFIHSQGVLHRDLKSANILVDKNFQAKLADFGLAKINTDSVSPTHKSSQAISWMPPECLRHDGVYTTASDIYSYGVILWELMTGKLPLEDCKDNMKSILTRVNSGERDAIPDSVPSVYQQLIKKCQQIDPSERPTLNFIIKQLQDYKEALICCEQAAQAEAKGDLNAAYLSYQKSANGDCFKAYTKLGYFFLKGMGGAPVDMSVAKQNFTKAAERGHVRSMFDLAMLLAGGSTNSKTPEALINMAQALQWYEKAADNGHETAMIKAAEILEKGDKEITVDKKRALALYEKAAVSKETKIAQHAQKKCEALRKLLGPVAPALAVNKMT